MKINVMDKIGLPERLNKIYPSVIYTLVEQHNRNIPFLEVFLT